MVQIQAFMNKKYSSLMQPRTQQIILNENTMHNHRCRIIGLSIAREFALKGIQTILLEANNDIGLETSFRNSAVIHAGVYY